MPGERLPERLSPLASAMGLRPFYGDLHNHCDISYGHGSLLEALKRARRQLDFVSVTGHAYWPDMPIDDERVAFQRPTEYPFHVGLGSTGNGRPSRNT